MVLQTFSISRILCTRTSPCWDSWRKPRMARRSLRKGRSIEQ